MLTVAKATVTYVPVTVIHMAFECRQDRPSFAISVNMDGVPL